MQIEIRRVILLFSVLLTATLFLACSLWIRTQLKLEDFAFLERGMTYEQIVAGLGEPQDRSEGSVAFVTYLYQLKDGEKVYLGFYPQANYLDSVYYDVTTTPAQIYQVDTTLPVIEMPDGWNLGTTIEYDVQDTQSGVASVRIVIEGSRERWRIEQP